VRGLLSHYSADISQLGSCARKHLILAPFCG
jgi:hypothetical protein